MYLVIRVHSYRLSSLLCSLSLTNPIIIIITEIMTSFGRRILIEQPEQVWWDKSYRNVVSAGYRGFSPRFIASNKTLK